MTKWIPRLIGVLVILVLGLFVASTWFSPPVPDALQRDLDLQVQGQPGQTPGQLRPVPQQELEPLVPDVPPPANAPTLTLTSLEDIPEEGSAPPVLTNPQPDNAATAPELPVQAPPAPPAAKPEKAPQQLAAQAPQPQQAARQPAPQPAAAPAGDSSWIAAGAFGNPENTERRVAQLRSRGWPVKVEKIQSGGKTLDRVMLGPVPSGQVNAYLDELNKMGVQGRQIQ